MRNRRFSLEFGPLLARLRSPTVQTLLLAGGTGIAQVGTAFMAILVARMAGPEEFGRVATAIAIGTFGAALIDFGSNSLWMRDFAIDPTRGVEMFQRLAAKVLFSAVLGAGWFVICLFLRLEDLLYAGLVMFTVLTAQTVVVPLRSKMRADITTIALLFDRVVAVGATLFLLRSWSSASVLIVASSIGNVAGAALAWQVGVRQIFVEGLVWRLQNPWARSMFYGITSASTQAQVLDVPLITALSDSTQSGLYGAVNRWVMPMSLLSGAFSQAILPVAATHADLKSAWLAIRRSSLLLIVTLVLDAFIFIFASQITFFLLGSRFEGTADILRLLAVGTAFISFNQPAAIVLQAQGHDRVVSRLLPLAIALQLTLIGIFVPRFGALGASMSFVVAQMILAGLLAVSLWKLRGHRRHL